MMRSLPIVCLALVAGFGLLVGTAHADTFANGDFEGSTTIFGGEGADGWFRTGQTGVTTGDTSEDPAFEPTGITIPLSGSVSAWTAVDSSLSTSTVSTSSAAWASFWTDASGDAVLSGDTPTGTEAFKSLLRTGGSSIFDTTPGDLVVSAAKYHFTHTEGTGDDISAVMRWFSDGTVAERSDVYFFVFVVDDLDSLIEASFFIIDATTGTSGSAGPHGEFDFRSGLFTLGAPGDDIPASTHSGDFTFFFGIAQEDDGSLVDAAAVWDDWSPSSPGTPTPEPGSYALAGIIAAGAYLSRRRRDADGQDETPDTA